MVKTIDQLCHFTKELATLKEIFIHGFKPSYASETLGKRKIKVAMVSLSNILLRDVGEQEVLNYGSYGIIMSRDWGIANKFNPVVYTYDEGLLQQGIDEVISNSVFLGYVENFKDKFKEMSDCKCGPFSKQIDLTPISDESKAIVDYLSMKYDEELIKAISAQNRNAHEINLRTIKLTKPYKVTNSKGEEFIAYNDREWRKIYAELPIIFEEDEEYGKWDKVKKPHFNDGPHLIRFGNKDVRAILVESNEEVTEMVKFLEEGYGKEDIKELLGKGRLIIGPKSMLEEAGF